MEYKGELKGFPTEVVGKMLEKQVEQGNFRNVEIFEECCFEDRRDGGFDWNQTTEGEDFWSFVILKQEFDTFFEKYPKTENKEEVKKQFTKSDLKTGMLVQNDEGVVYLFVNNTFVGVGEWDDLCNYDSVLKNSVESGLDIVKVSNILKDQFLKPEHWTQETLNKNPLWERKEKTIEINGKTYLKKDVLNKISDLNTY